MPRLAFISDEDLEEAVETLLLQASHALKKAETKFEKNVIDPFAAIFEMAGFGLNEVVWRSNEKIRKAQKTLGNHIGAFHQSVLGKIKGWSNPGSGGIIDLVSTEQKIIAEIKNKYNTVKGSDLTHLYTDLENLVMPKASIYKDYTAYYVEIIPKKPIRYDVPFTPSDKSMGKKKTENSFIRKVDGYTFYKLVTGVDDALFQLFKVLPEVIESNKKNIMDYKFLNTQFLSVFFQAAFEI